MNEEPKPAASAAEQPEALAGLKVLELGSMLAGPFTSTLLGEFGAEVIKVEKTGKTGRHTRVAADKGRPPPLVEIARPQQTINHARHL